jgi:hypothetical protein
MAAPVAPGIAPARFAVRRRGSDTHAANFQREAGKITFCGPTHELPLRVVQGPASGGAALALGREMP